VLSDSALIALGFDSNRNGRGPADASRKASFVVKLSIIVPATGTQESLDETLLSVLENRPEHCQVIVCHPDSYRDPYDLSDEVQFVACGDGALKSLIHAGWQASRADIVHLLLPGVRATDGWTRAPLDRFARNPQLAAIAPALLESVDSTRLRTAGIAYRAAGAKRWVGAGRHNDPDARFDVDAPALHAGFYRRTMLAEIGGLDGRFGSLHLDTDLAARMRAMRLQCEFEPASRVWTDAKVSHPIRGFQEAYRAERLFWRHFAGWSSPWSLVLHSCHVTVDWIQQLPRAGALVSPIGRICGGLVSLFASNAACSDPRLSATEDAPVTLRIEEAGTARRARLEDPSERSSKHRYSRSA
jgi:hypothetical protein